MTNKKNTRSFNFFSILLLSVIISGFAVFQWLIDVETSPPSISQHVINKKPIIYFGVIARYSPREIYSGYQPFMDYLSQNSPYIFELKLSKDYNDTVDKLISGEIDFASLGNFTYIQAKKDHDIQCIAKPYNENGETVFYDNLVVKSDCELSNIKDFKNKKFAFASEQSFSFWMTRAYMLENDLHLYDLEEYDNFHHHDIVAEKILKGEFDIGAIKDVVAKRYLSKGLKIIHTSKAIPGVPIVARPNVDPKKLQIFQKVLLEIKTQLDQGSINTKGWDKEIAYGFVPAYDGDYDFSRLIIKKVLESDFSK